VATFSPLLNVLADVPDPRRAQGQLYKLPYVLLFSILAIVTGCTSYRGIVTFIAVHRRKLNAAFPLKWKRAPAHTAIRYILQGLDPAAVEAAFRRHAAQLQAARATPGQGSIALDGKTLRGSFDKYNDRAAAQMLSAFATDTALVLAHVDIAEKSNEIPAAQTLLAGLGVANGTELSAFGRRSTRCRRGPGISAAQCTPSVRNCVVLGGAGPLLAGGGERSKITWRVSTRPSTMTRSITSCKMACFSVRVASAKQRRRRSQ